MPTDLPAPAEAPASPPKPLGLDGNRTSTNERGIVLPYVVGYRRVALKWISSPFNFWTRNIKQKVGKKKKTVAKDVYCSIAGALCLGPLDRVVDIRYGGKPIWSSGYTFRAGQDVQTIHTDKGKFHVYRGSVNQAVSSLLRPQSATWSGSAQRSFRGWFEPIFLALQSRLGGGQSLSELMRDEHPSYPGIAYVDVESLYCGRNTQAVPNLEVVIGRSPEVPSWLPVDRTLRDNGCNPVAIIGELLARPELGVGLPQQEIDTAELIRLGEALARDPARYYLSVQLDAQKSASDVLGDILRHFDGFQANREGRLSLGYFPKDGVLPEVTTITQHHLTEQPQMTLPDWADTVNRVVVKFPNRANGYEEDSVDRKSNYNQRIQKRLVTKNLEASAIIDPAQASRFASDQLEVLSVPEDSGKITVLAHHAVTPEGEALQPGHRFRFVYEPWALDLICRVTTVTQKRPQSVTLNFVRERGLFAQPFVTPSDPPKVVEELSVPAITRAHVFELTRELAEADGVFIGILAEQPDGAATGFALWYSAKTASETRTFDSIGSSEYWAACGELAAPLDTDATEVIIRFDEGLDDFEPESPQAQLNDTLLLKIGSELLAVGHFEAIPEQEGYYRMEVLRGRRGSVAETHDTSETAWLFYREQLLRVTHSSFASDPEPQFKFQTIGLGTAQDLAEAILIHDFRFRDRTAETARVWIEASDYAFVTSYDAEGRATTTPTEITLTASIEGFSNPKLRWQRFEGGGWVEVVDVEDSELTVLPATAGRFRCVATEGDLIRESNALDVNVITEAAGGDKPFSTSKLIVDGKQVVGPRLPAVQVSFIEDPAQAAAIEELRQVIRELASRLDSTSGHGLIE